jgi:hypothetical protein
MRRILQKTPVSSQNMPVSGISPNRGIPNPRIFRPKTALFPFRKAVVPFGFLTQSEGRNITRNFNFQLSTFNFQPSACDPPARL